MKTAVTLCASVIFTLHLLAVPEQAPAQWAKAEPLAGLAVRPTDFFPTVTWAEQAEPHSIPAPGEMTSPWPEPARKTLSVRVARPGEGRLDRLRLS